LRAGGWYGSDEGGRLRVAHRNWQGQRRPDGLWDEDPRGSGWDSEAVRTHRLPFSIRPTLADLNARLRAGGMGPAWWQWLGLVRRRVG